MKKSGRRGVTNGLLFTKFPKPKLMDFTQTIYKILLETLKSKDYSFSTFKDCLNLTPGSTKLLNSGSLITYHSSLILLRHDVDRLPQNSLKLAQIEHSLGIKGTYYFRIVPESYNLEIMHQIADLGHEIGYHYEDIYIVIRNQRSGAEISK